MVYADAENLFSEQMNTETILSASKGVSVEIKAAKTEAYLHVLSPDCKTKFYAGPDISQAPGQHGTKKCCGV
jgi:hypothetical protein